MKTKQQKSFRQGAEACIVESAKPWRTCEDKSPFTHLGGQIGRTANNFCREMPDLSAL